MATILSVTSEYSGALAGELFLQAFKSSDSIAKNAITVLPNVIGSGALPKLSYSSGLSAQSCGWNPGGSVSYVEKSVATKQYQIQHELCKNDFHQTFAAQAAGLFASDNEIPSTVQEGILLQMINNMGAIVDFEIWQGTNTATSFNGLVPQFILDADVVKLTGVTITAINVVSQLERVYNAIIAEVEDDADMVIAVSKNVAKAYRQAIAAQGLNTTVGAIDTLDYLGMRMESLGGLPANKMAAYRVKNLAFLTGLESDMNEVRISDDESRLDGNVRTKMSFTAGVGYSFGAEIVYYGV